jgi:hypothetical protein
MTTQEIVTLVDAEGIGALQAELQCTRAQAEQTAILAQRAFRKGNELDQRDIPYRTARVNRRQ